MDFKFLNDRYMKGKENVEKFMNAHHRLQFNESLILGHSTIVDMQAAMGSQGFLCHLQVSYFFWLHTYRQFCGGADTIILFLELKAVARLTILIVDVTLWPQRAFIGMDVTFSKVLSQSTPSL